jgi:hypothetical protein
MAILSGCSTPSPVGQYSFDAIDPSVTSVLYGENKIVYEFTEDKKVTAMVGPMTVLSTDWKQDGTKVILGRGQEHLEQEYEMKDGNLVPIENGSPSLMWRLKKK